MLASAAFRGANRSGTLLRFIVGAALEGRGHYLKEYTLGVEALGRGASFDARVDPIVRVEVSRLRSRLDLYYTTEGAADQLLIGLPKGSYVPQFSLRGSATVASPLSERPQQPDRLPPSPWPVRRRYALWLGAAALLVWYSLSIWLRVPPAITGQPLHVDIALGAPGAIAAQVGSSLALSPDGEVLVFVAVGSDGSTRLFARRLDELDAVELEGSRGAVGPFLSPDGRWVGFWAEGFVRKTLVAGGGSPVTLAEAPDFHGATWGAGDTIIARLDRSPNLWRIPVDGGAASLLPGFDGELATFRWPQLLPDGQTLLGTTMRAAGPAIEIVRRDGTGRRTLIQTGLWGRYLASGHLAYIDRGTLFAVPFDLQRFETCGAPVRMLDDVTYDQQFGFAHLDIAQDGTLVYMRSVASGLSTIRWLDGADRSRPLLDEPARYHWPRLSPDGRLLAYGLLEGGDPDIWTLDLASGAKTRLNGAGRQSAPFWSPDSQYLLYVDESERSVLWRRADGRGRAGVLLREPAVMWSFTPDGTRLAYHRWSDETSFDLWTVPVEITPDGPRAGEPEPFLTTGAFENYPAFSPDGRWLAYCSNESGTWEVYVRAYPDDGSRVRVSSGGGCMPAWPQGESRLFYQTVDHRMMVLDYRIEDGSFLPGPASTWSSLQLADTGVLSNFDAARNGAGIAALIGAGAGQQRPREHVTLVRGFFDELQRGLARP